MYFPRTGYWYLLKGRDGFEARQFGFNSALPVQADYDADGRADIGVYYPPQG